MKTTKTDKIILVALYKATRDLYIHTLYGKYELQIGDLIKSIEKLEGEKMILVVEDRITLTDEGKKYVVNHSLTGASGIRKVKEEFLGLRMSVGSFYIPRSYNVMLRQIKGEQKN